MLIVATRDGERFHFGPESETDYDEGVVRILDNQRNVIGFFPIENLRFTIHDTRLWNPDKNEGFDA